MKKNILVLGSGGMLGHTTYNYLSIHFKNLVFGTEHLQVDDRKILKLNAEEISIDFKTIIQKLPNLEYVINCIGALKDSGNNLSYVNGVFPNKLAELCDKYKIKLIHVSTDAVFNPLSEAVNETNKPNPNDDYGKSKLAGEPNVKNCITFRTSIIGFDPKNHKGLLEWVLTNKSRSIPGYTNQNWTGCTTLQFAQLCEDIIANDKFPKMREISSMFHFAPLGPLTKHDLLNEFLQVSDIKTTLQKEKGAIINRILNTIYPDCFPNNKYTNNIKKALEELIGFEHL